MSSRPSSRQTRPLFSATSAPGAGRPPGPRHPSRWQSCRSPSRRHTRRTSSRPWSIRFFAKPQLVFSPFEAGHKSCCPPLGCPRHLGSHLASRGSAARSLGNLSPHDHWATCLQHAAGERVKPRRLVERKVFEPLLGDTHGRLLDETCSTHAQSLPHGIPGPVLW
eukprot:533378-Prymnesium_polylepis.2